MMGRPFTVKIAPLWGCEHHLIRDSLGLSEPTTQTASRLAQQFLHSSPHCPHILQWAAPSPSKLPLLFGRIWTPSNTWFQGPTQVLNPDGTWIGLACLQGSLV